MDSRLPYARAIALISHTLTTTRRMHTHTPIVSRQKIPRLAALCRIQPSCMRKFTGAQNRLCGIEPFSPVTVHCLVHQSSTVRGSLEECLASSSRVRATTHIETQTRPEPCYRSYLRIRRAGQRGARDMAKYCKNCTVVITQLRRGHIAWGWLRGSELRAYRCTRVQRHAGLLVRRRLRVEQSCMFPTTKSPGATWHNQRSSE